MSITYSLHKNHLATAPEGSFRAVVHFKDTVNTDKLIDRMMEREPGITREVAEAAVKLYLNTIYAYVLDGHRVVTPFGVVGVSIKGNFTRQRRTALTAAATASSRPCPPAWNCGARSTSGHRSSSKRPVPLSPTRLNTTTCPAASTTTC